MLEGAVILIADDSRAHRDTLVRILAGQCDAILIADSVDSCLAQTKQAHLVIINGQMRNADRLCSHIRGGSSLPILMIAPDKSGSFERALAMGAHDVLTRPFDDAALVHRVNALLNMQALQARYDESETRWRHAFDLNRAIKLLVDPQTGLIVDANAAARSFYGYSREEFQQLRLSDLDAPLDTSVSASKQTMYSFRHRLKSGELRDVKVFSGPVPYGGRTLLFLIVYDMTKRRQAEAAEQDHRAMADALRNTAEALTSTLDQHEVMDRILEQVQHVVPHEYANIMLVDNGIARIVRLRGYRKLPGTEDHHKVSLSIEDTPTLRWMVENKQALAIPNVDEYPGWVGLPSTREWMKSYVGAPIRLDKFVIGFLNLDSTSVNRFRSSDADRLQAFADQAAIAIRNARLYDRVRKQALELEQRVAERTAELEYERRQLHTIINSMTEGVAYTEYTDGVFRTRYINNALEQITGYTPEEWNTESLQLFKRPDMTDEQFWQTLGQAIQTLMMEGTWREEIRLVRKDGTSFIASAVTTRVNDADGKMIGAVTVLRDVSEERALQQQKARFVAHASHELRTPITNMKTRLYLLKKQPERMTEHVRVLEEVSDRMKRLVEDLLDVSRFERGVIKLQHSPIMLQEVVENVVDLQRPEAERKNLRLSFKQPDEPVKVHADRERLIQVVTNLVTNAINYTPPGGSIIVRVIPIYGEDQQLRCGLVEVEDTGIGIAEEHLRHLFQPFYRVTSKVEGSGLGLSIAKEIVELHGGRMHVESQPGHGSCFSFWLPAAGVYSDVPVFITPSE